MLNGSRVPGLAAAVALSAVALASGGCASAQDPSGAPRLTRAEVRRILDQAEAKARETESLVRVDRGGGKGKCRMHVVVVNRRGAPLGIRSMADAWVGSQSIARSKAFTAAAFSSDENALTTRSIGSLSQPGGALWNIGNSNRGDGVIEFPGGLPLYKDGRLVGGIGVSGDGVEQDEDVAEAGAKGFEPAAAIRADAATGGTVPFTK